MNLNIENYRKEKGLSQKILAKRCNITQGYLSRIENYIEYPSLLVLIDLAYNLEICPHKFACSYICTICSKEHCMCLKNTDLKY